MPLTFGFFDPLILIIPRAGLGGFCKQELDARREWRPGPSRLLACARSLSLSCAPYDICKQAVLTTGENGSQVSATALRAVCTGSSLMHAPSYELTYDFIMPAQF